MSYIGVQPTAGQYRKLDNISSGFNGSTTAFTTSVSGTNVTAGTAQQLLVSLGGVIQQPDTDYTVSTNTITFTTAPTSGLSFFAVLMGDALNTVSVSDGAITTAKLAGSLSVGLAAGTAAAPSLYFTGDANTGIYSLGADQVAISTGGTGRLFVDSSGRVGIGTSSPDTNSRLHVSASENTSDPFATDASVAISNYQAAGNNEAASLKFLLGTAPGTNAGSISCHYDSFSAGVNSSLRFYTVYQSGFNSPAERMRIDPQGRVGIGTTAPSTELHISRATAGRVITRLADPDGRTTELRSPDNVGNAAGVGTTTNHPFVFFQNNTEAARVDDSKRLLVGTSTARANFFNATESTKLQVEGTVTGDSSISVVRNSNNTGYPFIAFGKTRGTAVGATTIVQSGDSVGGLEFMGSDGTEFVPAGSIRCEVDGTPGANDMPGRIVLSTTADGAASPTERMRITNGGNVLIHKTSAGLGIDGLELINTGGTCVQVTQSGNGTGAFIANMRYGSGTQYAMYIDFSGSVVGSITCTSTATAFNTSSDYRLKENILPVTDGITRLQQLKPSRFNFIADPDIVVDGFIAHEVQDVVPEAITGEKDAVDEEGKPKYQGIDQSKLVPLLTAALQEAIGEIESLKARVAALESA